MSLIALIWLVWSPVASAAPNGVDNLPGPLQKYVPGSSGWVTSPWMTSPSCLDKGGDFSLWVGNVIADIPKLVPVFFSEMLVDNGVEQDRLRNWEVYRGFQQLSAEFRDAVPAGYCVDDMKRWAGTYPEYKPFGFAWGITHQTPYVCTDGRAAERGRDADNRWIGADRAVCHGFFVACDTAPDAEQARCAAWDAFSLRFTRRGQELRDAAINRYPARGVATYHTEVAWPWVVVVAGTGAIALTGMGALIVRRRRTAAPTVLGGGDVRA